MLQILVGGGSWSHVWEQGFSLGQTSHPALFIQCCPENAHLLHSLPAGESRKLWMGVWEYKDQTEPSRIQ